MSSRYLEITLLEDVVLSANPATAGAHTSLDYLPGAAFLGIVASQLFSRLTQEESFQLFYSGQVRFGNGLPAIDSIPCLPAPKCWHYPKGQDYYDGHNLLKDNQIYHLGLGDMEGQAKALRDGYVQPFSGAFVHPERVLRMKTAIDSETGRVAEGQLFAYEAIAAGTRYIARLDWDESVPHVLIEQIQKALVGTRYFGRSRSAEYGAADIRLLDLAPSLPEESLPETNDTQDLVLWCTSDLALLDPYGQYTTDAQPAFALPDLDGTLLLEKSFISIRSYAPWNAYRRCRDPERQVIQQGSILHWHFPNGIKNSEVSVIKRGIGIHQEAGLGQVLVQPTLLQTVHPKFTARELPQNIAHHKSEKLIPDNKLARWLTNIGGDDPEAVRRLAQEWLKELQQLQIAACLYGGLEECEKTGPSVQQWGRVLDAAKKASSFASLKVIIFDGNSAIAKETGEGWNERGPLKNEFISFHNWFMNKVKQLDSTQNSNHFKIRVMREFTREAQDLVKNRQREHQTHVQ